MQKLDCDLVSACGEVVIRTCTLMDDGYFNCIGRAGILTNIDASKYAIDALIKQCHLTLVHLDRLQRIHDAGETNDGNQKN